MSSLEYWRKRETEAKKKYITDENEYAKEIQAMYLRTLDRVQKEIDSFYTRYAAKEGITIADAKKRADKLDMEAYAAKAKKYVKNRDFSKQANDEMRLYNLTMKVNRLELLKANIGLELVQQSEDLQQFMNEKLTGRTLEELQRQAGILGESISDEAQVAKRIVNASFHNATFSERIWQNHTLLKADLAKQLEIGLIQGKHPTVLARDLRKTWDVSQYQALRLMRTELARVQIDAQMQFYDNAGVTEYTYITCGFGDACPFCRALDGRHFKTSDMLPGENAPPMHPNCHCSTSAYMDRNSIDWLKDEAESAGKISNTSERERVYIQDDGKREPGHVNLSLVNTKKYHDRYDNLTVHKDVNESLYRASMEILKDRNNTEFEDIVAIDARTGDIIVKNTSASTNKIKHRCGFSWGEQSWLEERRGMYEVLHNHPNNSLPSRDDIKKLFDREHQSGSTIICHNGDIYRIEKLKKHIENIDNIISKAYSKVKKDLYGYSKNRIEEETSQYLIKLLERSGHIQFTKR